MIGDCSTVNSRTYETVSVFEIFAVLPAATTIFGREMTSPSRRRTFRAESASFEDTTLAFVLCASIQPATVEAGASTNSMRTSNLDGTVSCGRCRAVEHEPRVATRTARGASARAIFMRSA